MLSKHLNHREKKVLMIVNIGICFLIVLLYLINTIYIKPRLNEDENWHSYFMINYFNDVGAGLFIASYSNILFIHSEGKFPSAFKFYLILSILECIIWEFIRPFVLILFNPFHKSPKFLWGDMVAYTVGTMMTCLIVTIIYKGIKNAAKKTNNSPKE